MIWSFMHEKLGVKKKNVEVCMLVLYLILERRCTIYQLGSLHIGQWNIGQYSGISDNIV